LVRSVGRKSRSGSTPVAGTIVSALNSTTIIRKRSMLSGQGRGPVVRSDRARSRSTSGRSSIRASSCRSVRRRSASRTSTSTSARSSRRTTTR
jgi:hypothetical protein